jgi:23S rRNA (cytidine1920-2'-O)/16S rRNA (cytidine1409-2'-O)-methyltransferase
VRRGLVESREAAAEAIRAGLVTVDGAPAIKPATQVLPDQALAVTAPPRAYVSRGGEKLAHGLDAFAVDPAGRHCLDAGVSTGGFTDCLLQRGAVFVHAYDVGYGQVHDRIRTDPRVAVHERTNIRDVTPADLDGPCPDLVVCDVSFIALRTVLPTLRALGAPDAEAVVLVKPQFEAQKTDVGKGGVVRDPEVWRRVLTEVAEAAAAVGWQGFAVTPSPLLGPAGNVEFLAHLTVAPGGPVDAAVDAAVAAGQVLAGRDRPGGG